MSRYNRPPVVTLDHLLAPLVNYRDKPRVRADVMACATQFPTLIASIGVFADPAGRPQNAVQLSGTIPIFYQRVQYNIPVALWVGPNFPLSCPDVFVTPTTDMQIKANHKHVDAGGRVYLPYLSSWDPRRSTVVALVQDMCAKFSEEPPVHRKPVGSPGPMTQPVNRPSTLPNPYFSTPVVHSSPPSSHYGSSSAVTPPTYTVDPKKQAVENVTSKGQARMAETFRELTEEIDLLFDAQAALANSQSNLSQGLSALAQEKIALEDKLKQLETADVDLDAWVARHADSTPDKATVESLVETKDIYSKQLVDLVSEEAAIEDVLFHLSQALDRGCMDLDTFLKYVRELSRKQFLQRVLRNKIVQAQQAQMITV
eukprot:GILJ01007813.1.p1 GENE.GILJ01007813.1~~GILJ01007813.1.p1  ORF type:complete len:371 (+),score=70.74 GILJ01007813.1:59-1171(+)